MGSSRGLIGRSDSDFFPIHPYETVFLKTSWYTANGPVRVRAEEVAKYSQWELSGPG